MKNSDDYEDYVMAVRELGYTVESAFEKFRKYHSLRDINLLKTRIGASEIQGLGVFATENIPLETEIEKALDGRYTTQVGRYVNHSASPNAKVEYRGKDLFLISIIDIMINSEITINYRILGELYATRLT
jgi:hypothetical protein